MWCRLYRTKQVNCRAFLRNPILPVRRLTQPPYNSPDVRVPANPQAPITKLSPKTGSAERRPANEFSREHLGRARLRRAARGVQGLYGIFPAKFASLRPLLGCLSNFQHDFAAGMVRRDLLMRFGDIEQGHNRGNDWRDLPRID
jgi:hypothetical protein